jgi:hypothetical protein
VKGDGSWWGVFGYSCMRDSEWASVNSGEGVVLLRRVLSEMKMLGVRWQVRSACWVADIGETGLRGSSKCVVERYVYF